MSAGNLFAELSVTNLVANAIRFVSSQEERRIEVRLDIGTLPPAVGTCTKPPEPHPPAEMTNDEPLYLYTEVADTGPGLMPSELETLFQRFTQASEKTHTAFGGSGLGLFVCRKITELMGGRIEVATEYTCTRGSVFRFYVKTRPCVAKVKTTRTPTAGPGAYALRVLIVEDNMINRTVLQRQLKHVRLKPDCEFLLVVFIDRQQR